MSVEIRKYEEQDISEMINIWNDIVEIGEAFPQEDLLDDESARVFFRGQAHTGVAAEDHRIMGLYILHPNNIGRCGHIANASYAVKGNERGKRIGEKLVLDSIERCRDLGFRILQFNAVVATNEPALNLYKALGFVQLGKIPGGFRDKTGEYKDIIPHYINTCDRHR